MRLATYEVDRRNREAVGLGLHCERDPELRGTRQAWLVISNQGPNVRFGR